ncbi:hypothetical protein AYI69_g720 [Smittium culicis]|uniref:Uncharacterized protein n=1 Tax=Smittium culicis TaxID=133412 RepID=A0A1R1YS79_9FUNG|nr:hypothetical protein AYI69_g720 [Smittium culicis]
MARGQVEKDSQNINLHAPHQSSNQQLQEILLQPNSDQDFSSKNSSLNNESMWSKFITEDLPQPSSSDSENSLTTNNTFSSKNPESLNSSIKAHNPKITSHRIDNKKFTADNSNLPHAAVSKIAENQHLHKAINESRLPKFSPTISTDENFKDIDTLEPQSSNGLLNSNTSETSSNSKSNNVSNTTKNITKIAKSNKSSDNSMWSKFVCSSDSSSSNDSD